MLGHSFTTGLHSCSRGPFLEAEAVHKVPQHHAPVCVVAGHAGQAVLLHSPSLHHLMKYSFDYTTTGSLDKQLCCRQSVILLTPMFCFVRIFFNFFFFCLQILLIRIKQTILKQLKTFTIEFKKPQSFTSLPQLSPLTAVSL